jgi:hypothetical protein
VLAGARIIVIDSSHGACQDARQLLRALKREFRDAPLQVIVGNIASYASAQFLLERDPSAADARRGRPAAARRAQGRHWAQARSAPRAVSLAPACRS